MQKQTIEWFRTNGPRSLWTIGLGALLFLSMAHHALNFWEYPALAILAAFAIGAPLVAWVIARPALKLAGHAVGLNKRRLILMSVFALLTGIFVAWRIYRAPLDYQTITITPGLSRGQQITLLELKQDGHRVKLEPSALQSGWQPTVRGYSATDESQPLTLSFKSRVNAPVTLLFATSADGGRVQVTFEGETAAADLRGADGGELGLNFSARYRGLPNWIFVPALVAIDAIAIAALVLALLLMQEAGQQVISPAAAERFPDHRSGLLTLLGLGLVLHILSALSTPLLIYADSPAYLQGAVHWLEHGSLAGVPVFRGPGTTILFAPILGLFGRNPWGMKILLHMLALLCIPLSYRLAWQLSGRRLIAFLGSLLAVLTPDMYLYSNFVMSDLVNLTLVLAFCTLLISAVKTPDFRTALATFLTGSLAALVRSENVLLPAIGLVVLALPPLLAWVDSAGRAQAQRHVRSIALAFALAAIPLLWWSSYYHELHGFYSLGNHSGVVLYDGWVYYGDASKLSFSNPDSPAMQEIRAAMAAHGAAISDRTGAPTSLELYPAMQAAGYSDYEIFELLEQAGWDSIRRDPALTIELLFIKLEASLKPEIGNTATYRLPGEAPAQDPLKLEYFELENVSIPPLIRAQRALNEAIYRWYPRLYPIWIAVCILALGLSLFRSPAAIWPPLVLIVATRIFVPAVMALSSWRYTLAGWIPLEIIAVCCITTCVDGLRALRTEKPIA